MKKDNRSYYDDFAGWYEKERHHGYNAFLDRLQVELAEPISRGKAVLEIGCGTGMILKEIAPLASSAIGVDISQGMLLKARSRGLAVAQGSATDLPFGDETFDAVYSFKVLAHVADISKAMSEVERVLRPGGQAVLEFYNRRSLRYFIKSLKPAHRISATTTDEQVYTRYDSLDDVRSYLPQGLRLEGVRGIRVFTPFAQVHHVPGLRRVMASAERFARDFKPTAHLGGFLVVLLRKASV